MKNEVIAQVFQRVSESVQLQMLLIRIYHIIISLSSQSYEFKPAVDKLDGLSVKKNLILNVQHADLSCCF